MSRIETEIWEPVPDKPGHIQYVGQRKASEVFQNLENFLREENIYPDEYFLPNQDFDDKPDLEMPRIADIFCYAQWGGSEGVYLEVEFAVKHPTENRYTRVNFASGKTLGESSEDFDRMQYIAGRIYKAFTSEGCESSRFVAVPDGKKSDGEKDEIKS